MGPGVQILAQLRKTTSPERGRTNAILCATPDIESMVTTQARLEPPLGYTA